MNEIWKPIRGYDNDYAVSNTGLVVSFKRGSKKLLTLEKTHDGYLRAALSDNGKTTRRMVHCLVAEAFLKGDGQVDHLDFNKQNNNVENLEYVTGRENVSRAWRAGRKEHLRNSRKEANRKLTNPQVKIIFAATEAGEKLLPLAKKYGVSIETISRIKRRKIYVDQLPV